MMSKKVTHREGRVGEDNRTTQLLEVIADDLYVFRKDQQEHGDL